MLCQEERFHANLASSAELETNTGIMAAYAQFGYTYPPASQLLVSGGQTTTASSQSPISATNAPSLSPGGSATGAPSGALSPGAVSQTSQNNAPLSGGGRGGGGGGGGGVGGGGPATSCCENGRPIMTDPVSGQTVCSCQYDSARLALSGYSRIPTGSVGVYGTPYPSTEQNPYPSIGVDSSAFYSPLSNPYALKDSGPTSDMTAWTSAGLQPTTGYYPYDPTLAAYGYGAGYDLAARRKNATRESTATLKAWLNEHKKNPYPTKGEKIMLAIITKMTLTQVSTWFANARRRLKKENKMTWEPKNKTDDDDDAMVSDDEKDKDDLDPDKGGRDHKDMHHHHHHQHQHHVKSEHDKDDEDDDLTDDERKPENLMGHPGHLGQHHPYYHHSMLGGHHQQNHLHHQQQQQHHHAMQHQQLQHHHGGLLKAELDHSKNQTGSDCGVPIPASKPKIWSLADTAACKTPPPHHLPLHHLQQHAHHQQQQQQQLHHQQQHHQQQHQQHQQQQQGLHNSWMSGTNTGYHPNQSQHHLQQQQQQQHLQQSQHHLQQHHAAQQHHNGSNSMMMIGDAGSPMSMSMGNTSSNNSSTTPPNNLSSSNSNSSSTSQGMGPASMGSGMMNSFASTPYSRYGGFLAGAPHYNTTPLNNNNSSSSNSSTTNSNPSTTGPVLNHPTTPTLQQQQQGVQQQQQQQPPMTSTTSQQQQQSMGFPEVQTDTPPQTPPNMKLPSMAANLLTTPTTGTCYSSGAGPNGNQASTPSNNNNNNNPSAANNNNNNNNHHQQTGSSGQGGSSSGYASSPDSMSQQGNGTPSGGYYRMQQQDQPDGFKPFFKNSSQVGNGFVSPV